ncbi:uncharacterized protein LOC113274652 [Papaver somniferum]|uniref:uncharacterized protein LOC113274645 n=1 Tax=Papaver somniferum TaxID=3469 RepID=UPI000E6FBEAE|nr:uncharacterized protein LOC113274645 [Papaver somniferum]XP_026379836.1 uncharacterized protein LOC113274652 [Papaver somniferum]
MPFGLKNAGATYQRMVGKVFEKWIHTTIEVYVDDMLVKSKEAEDHVDDLREIFEHMRKFNISRLIRLSFAVLSSPKSQIIAEFLAEFPLEEDEYVEDMMDVDEKHGNLKDLLTDRNLNRWEILVDGSSNGEGNGIGIVFISPEGARMSCSFRLEFASTNNETEYEAVVHALKLAIEMEVKEARVTSDSQLVIRQIKGKYCTNEPSLQKYKKLVMELAERIPNISWRHIGRKYNRLAHALAFIPSMLIDLIARDIKMQTLYLPSIKKEDET